MVYHAKLLLHVTRHKSHECLCHAGVFKCPTTASCSLRSTSNDTLSNVMQGFMLGPNVNECVRYMETISISVRCFIECGQQVR